MCSSSWNARLAGGMVGGFASGSGRMAHISPAPRNPTITRKRIEGEVCVVSIIATELAAVRLQAMPSYTMRRVADCSARCRATQVFPLGCPEFQHDVSPSPVMTLKLDTPSTTELNSTLTSP